MKKQIVFFVGLALLGVFMIALEGCKDDCEGTIKTSGEFRTYNELEYYDKVNGETTKKIKIVEEDTFMLSYVTFEANEKSAESYEWTIGSDPKKRNEKKFTLRFSDPGVISENPLPIKLKVIKAPNTKCFHSDTGIDSVTHFIYFLAYDKWPVYGKYLGSDNTNPNEKYTINIFAGFKNGYYTTDSLKNLPNNCSKLPVSLSGSTAFEFTIFRTDLVFNNKIYPAPDCGFRELDKHIGYLKPDRKTIVIDYQFVDKGQQDASLQKRIFTGIRQ
jgi:hypothetical protein